MTIYHITRPHISLLTLCAALFSFGAAGVISSTAYASAGPPPSFHKMPSGCARDIAAGNGQYPWVVGCDSANQHGNHIYYWGGTEIGWVLTNGAATRISATYAEVYNGATMNYPAVVNAAGEVYFGVPAGSDLGSTAGQSVSWEAVVQPVPSEGVFKGCGDDVSSPVVTYYPNVDQPELFVHNCDGTGVTLYVEQTGGWQPVTLTGTNTALFVDHGFVGSAPVPFDVPIESWFVDTAGRVNKWDATSCISQFSDSCTGNLTNTIRPPPPG